MAKKSKDQYSDKEAQRRFEAALRGGLKTPPTPLKKVTAGKSKKPVRKPSR